MVYDVETFQLPIKLASSSLDIACPLDTFHEIICLKHSDNSPHMLNILYLKIKLKTEKISIAVS